MPDSSETSLQIESFMQKLLGPRCLTYEICPDKSPSVSPIIERVKTASLQDKIDAFVCTDSPLAKLKTHAGLASIRLQEGLGKPVICTISMRDKNSLALGAEFLGLNDFDIRIFLALSGDPLKLGDQPQAKPVFEGGSTKILELIASLNEGIDPGGVSLKAPVNRIYGLSVINSYAKNMDLLKKKMESKIKAGALALFTQPIYELEVSKILHEWLDELNARHGTNCALMQGFFPITSYKRACFLYEKLPGVFIPKSWLDTLSAASLRGADYERDRGRDLSYELFRQLYDYRPKIHIMNHNAIKGARALLDCVCG